MRDLSIQGSSKLTFLAFAYLPRRPGNMEQDSLVSGDRSGSPRMLADRDSIRI